MEYSHCAGIAPTHDVRNPAHNDRNLDAAKSEGCLDTTLFVELIRDDEDAVKAVWARVRRVSSGYNTSRDVKVAAPAAIKFDAATRA